MLDTEFIWTDGSHMEDHMGAGFMQEVNGTLNSSQFYLGKHLEVFDAELLMSHPIMCDNRLGNMYNLRENMANSTGE
jgi:hypothetical protein